MAGRKWLRLPKEWEDFAAMCARNSLSFIPTQGQEQDGWQVHWILKVEDEIAVLLQTKNPILMQWERLAPEKDGVPIRLSIQLPDGSVYFADSFVNPKSTHHRYAMDLMAKQEYTYVHVVTNNGLWWVATKLVGNHRKDVWQIPEAASSKE